MISSLRKIVKKWERQRDRVRRDLAQAIQGENIAREALTLLKEDKRQIEREHRRTSRRVFRQTAIDLEYYDLADRRCNYLTAQIATTSARIGTALETLEQRCREKNALSSQNLSIVNRLEHLESRIQTLCKIRDVRNSAVDEEDTLETWQTVNAMMNSGTHT